tara:strand:- start:4476 stop:4742 length:267 start_codon:yes stop_codon:yes gene_type:complete
VNYTAADFVQILSRIENVMDSTLLNTAQQHTIFTEMLTALPATFYCTQSQQTRKIVSSILEDKINARNKRATRSSAKKATQKVAPDTD